MSFLYPRVVTISRPNPTTGIGAQTYQGVSPSNETILFTGVPASIQHRGGASQKAGIPADAKGVPVWQVIIPLAALIALGTIQERDIITDDTGRRYQIVAAYWNSLGYQAECELLQT